MSAPAGGRRDTKSRSAKQVTRRERRLKDPRIQAALEEVQAHQAVLEAEIATREAVGEVVAREDHVHSMVFVGDWPRRYACCGKIVPDEADSFVDELPAPAVPAALKAESGKSFALVRRSAEPKQPDLPENGDGNGSWTLGQARSMLMQGYLLSHVVTTTGFGTRWFSDVPLHPSGHGVSRDEWIASIK